MENKRDRHFTEEEIKDKIVQSAEGMEVPDSLKPENIEKIGRASCRERV